MIDIYSTLWRSTIPKKVASIQYTWYLCWNGL